MNSPNTSYQISRALFLAIGFFASTVGFARGGGDFHGGGGYHQGDIGNGGFHQDGAVNNGYHHDNVGVAGDNHFNDDGAYHNDNDYNHYGNGGYDYVSPNIGNYYPGNGWVDPTVVINPNDNNSNCQTVQNCNDAGTCIIQNEDCN